MKRVYIAGAYTAADYLGVEDNIAAARRVAAQLASKGIGFFCPHTHSAHFDAIVPEVPPEYWYELDLLFLRDCDALYLLPGWSRSKGAIAERDEAQRLGLPVFDDMGDVAMWLESLP